MVPKREPLKTLELSGSAKDLEGGSKKRINSVTFDHCRKASKRKSQHFVGKSKKVASITCLNSGKGANEETETSEHH